MNKESILAALEDLKLKLSCSYGEEAKTVATVGLSMLIAALSKDLEEKL